MIVSWLVYCLMVSALVGVAGLAGERALRAQGWPGRWAWAAALAVSVGVPMAVWLSPSPAPAAGMLTALPGAYVMESLTPLSLAGGAPGPSGLELALAGWAAVSSLLLLCVLFAALRLYGERRAWRRREVDGVEVLVSRRRGPAAMGLLRGRIVVPEWALGLDERLRRLLVLHEAEHLRAADPQLALAGLLVCVLMPWNLPLWWQLHRLRLAVELDCDDRVLRRSRDVDAYGALLLEVGYRRRARLAVGLAESKSMLERRIRMITRATKGRRTLRAVGLAAISGLVLAVACETPGPTELSAPQRDALELEDVRSAGAFDGCEPLVYLDGGRVPWSTVNDDLDPETIEIVEVLKGGSGPECGVVWILTKAVSPEAEDHARRVLEALVARHTAQRGGSEPASDTRSLEELGQEPTFTPMTVRPTLVNASDVRAAIARYYPPLLRDAGIGGTVNVWFFIDREGRVVQRRINTSSGHGALDLAALKVAETMQFTPAYNRDERVPVWVALDVRFEADSADAPEPPEARRSMETSLREEMRAAMADESRPFITKGPRLINADEVREALASRYPPLLRDAGIEAEVEVQLEIDVDGVVRDAWVSGPPPGYAAFESAALAVARMMRFDPAEDRGSPSPVRLVADLRFEQ